MDTRTRKRILFLFILTGLLILNYPFISQSLNEGNQSSLIETYQNELEQLKPDEKKEMLKEAKEYNASLAKKQEGVMDAFSAKEENDESYKQYEQLLNPQKNGMMGYVEIPMIHVNIPIYHGNDVEVLEKGAGHLYGSSLPVGGESTHSIISSHRGLPSKELFTDLDQVKVGDYFFITVLDEKMVYQVDSIQTVRPEDTKSLGIIDGEDYVTLVTCTPYGVNSHRLLVRGKRIPWEESARVKQEQTGEVGIHRILMLVCIASCIVLLISMKILLFPAKKRRKEDRQDE